MKKRSIAIIVVSVALVAVLSFAGVAYAADGAVPGDTLYGLDCALEDAGLGDGGLEERLTESGELIDDGQVEEGLQHAAEALADEQDDGNDDGDLEDEEDTARGEALLAAADAVLSGGSEQSLEVRTRVAEKLRFMATTELAGKEYGQAVSEFARGIYIDDQAGQDGDPADTNNGKPKDSKEKSPKGNGKSR